MGVAVPEAAQVQGTPAWHHWRSNVLSASNAGIIMDCAPSYWSRRSWEDLRNPEPEPDAATRKLFQAGHQAEARYREELGGNWVPRSFQREEEGWMFGASLDLATRRPWGWDWIEVKSSRSLHSKIWEAADPANTIKEAVPHVWWQLVHQAAVLQPLTGSCWLAIVDQNDERKPVRRPVDTETLLADWPELADQWRLWAEGQPQGRSDPDWLAAAALYRVAKARADSANQALVEARQHLLVLADRSGSDKVLGGGLTLTLNQRSRVRWGEAVKDLLGDQDMAAHLVKFTDISQSWTVRQTKPSTNG